VCVFSSISKPDENNRDLIRPYKVVVEEEEGVTTAAYTRSKPRRNGAR
jgi:hypothetical protein